MEMKFVSKDNLIKFWERVNSLKQDKLPTGEVGTVLASNGDTVSWISLDQYVTEEKLQEALKKIEDIEGTCDCTELTEEDFKDIFGE